MKSVINIAIDGPVASGKGAVTRGLSARLGIPALDTGALYRAVTWYLLQNQIALTDEKAVVLALPKMQLQVFTAEQTMRVFVAGHDITAQLRDNQISINTPVIASYQGVRDFVNQQIAIITSQNSYILEGRDIGTVVLPHAQYKFFLTASVVERARRRQKDLADKQQQLSLAEVMAQIKARDAADMSRPVAPLKQAPDAILVDSTDMTLEQVIDTMAKFIKL